MKRVWAMVAAAAIYAMLPSSGTELGRLRPAAMVFLEKQNQNIRVSTDIGDCGIGQTLDEALRDLKSGAPGEVFLHTAEILLVSEETRELVPKMQPVLRPTVRVCAMEEIPREGLWSFLQIHRPSKMLGSVFKDDTLQILRWKEGSYRLEEKTE